MTSLLRSTWFNGAGLVVWTAAVIYLFAMGQPRAAFVWALGLAFTAYTVGRSLRQTNDDRERIAAVQPSDEREVLLSTRAFAIVGQFAFLAQLAVVAWHMGRPDEPGLGLAAATMVALAPVLLLANWHVMRQA